MVLEFVP
jgi:serine/threonine protein kinase